MARLNKTAFLSKVSLFSLMRKEDLQRIAEQTRYQLFHDGDLIIEEGERDGRLFMILGGKVEVIKNLGQKNERQLRMLGTHSYFGEMALIDNLLRSASIVARGETETLSLDRWDLRREIEKYPTIALELLQMLSRRIRAIEKSMVSTLGDLLPICSGCKKIREGSGTWTPIEAFISDRSETEFTHGLCPECAIKMYGDCLEED